MKKVLTLLFPRPQQLKINEGHLTISNKIIILLPFSLHQILSVAIELQNKLKNLGFSSEIIGSSQGLIEKSANLITLRVGKAIFSQSESYKIVIDDSGIHILGADKSGLYFGVITFIQLIYLIKRKTDNQNVILPHLTIEDWPDFSNRGVMIDVSRDKVPKIETLYDLIDLLSNWKINQVQLYFEHTFAYRGHKKVWKDASPFTGEEIIALNRFCRERFIDLVPNQNSFGHFHRWLIHDPYRDLAECPDGIDHPFSKENEPFSLNPTDPRSIELLQDLYDQLLPYFSSHQFNVGLDETFDLGEGRSAKACAEKGKAAVYLDFFKKIYALVSHRGKKMQFWADIVFEYPELIPKLPKDVIALIWGYEADHPFEEQCKIMKDTGLPLYVCPGTSSWNSITGRTDNAIKNLRNAAINGKRNNAIGFLNTDWGDHGHLQPLPVSFVGFLVGAGLSWNTNSEMDNVPSLLDVHAFRDTSGIMGKLVYDLGNAYNKVGFTVPNNSVLFLILLLSIYSMPKVILEKVDRENLEIMSQYLDKVFGRLSVENLEITRQYIDEIAKHLIEAKMQRIDADLIIKEFQWAADILTFACDLGIARILDDIPEETRAILAGKLHCLIDQHREIWLKRNREGGLKDSVDRLTKIILFLENDLPEDY